MVRRLVSHMLLFFAVLLPAAAEEQAPVLTLEQCIDAALANGDDIRILQGNLDVGRAQHAENVSKNSLALSGSAGAGYNYPQGDARVLAAKSSAITSSSPQGALFGLSLSSPMTSLSASADPWSPPVSVGTKDTYSTYSLSLTQQLWNGYPGGAARAIVEKSSLSLRAKELATESGRLNLLYRVKQVYFTMYSAQTSLEAKRETLKKQNGLLAQIQAVFNLQQASAVDLQTAQINARSAEIDVRSAEHDLRLARVRLAALMGRSPESEFAVAQPDEPQLPVATLTEAIAQAQARRVDVRQVELSRKSNTIDLRLARGQATPTVSVTGGMGWLSDWNGNNATVANVGLKVAMPILDAGAAKNLIDQGIMQDRVYDVQEQQLRKSIAADVQDAWETVQLLKEKVELAGLTAANDDLLVEVYKIQVQNGTSSNQDLLNAAVNAANARNALQLARSSAQLAVLQLLSIMGY
jgi:outer membrane protein TolC